MGSHSPSSKVCSQHCRGTVGEPLIGPTNCNVENHKEWSVQGARIERQTQGITGLVEVASSKEWQVEALKL